MILAPPIRHLTGHIHRVRIPARPRTAVFASTYLIARLVRLGRPSSSTVVAPATPSASKTNVCFFCGKPGHICRDCHAYAKSRSHRGSPVNAARQYWRFPFFCPARIWRWCTKISDGAFGATALA